MFIRGGQMQPQLGIGKRFIRSLLQNLCNIPELTLNPEKLNVSICSHQRSPQSLLATQKMLKKVCKETNQKLELRTVDTLGDLIPLYPTAWVVQKYCVHVYAT